MAVGDVKNTVFAWVAAGAAVTFQPAGTVEFRVEGIGSDQLTAANAPDVIVQLTDAISNCTHYHGGNVDTWFQKPLYINSGIYLRVVNNSGVQADMSMTGIQTRAQVIL